MEYKRINGTVKFILDMAPIVGFIAAYYFYDLMAATAVLMVATFISLIVIYAVERKVALAPLITGIMVGVFGAMTLLTQNDYFIKVKPTIVNMILAAILLIGAAFGKPLLKYVLEVAFKMTEKGWLGLSIRWGIFFIFLAILNEIIWRNFSTEFWVNFKLFGMLPLNILFWIVHVPYLQRHMLKDSK